MCGDLATGLLQGEKTKNKTLLLPGVLHGQKRLCPFCFPSESCPYELIPFRYHGAPPWPSQGL